MYLYIFDSYCYKKVNFLCLDWNILMRIIVMGSSEFAVPALKRLFENYHVIAVYTKEAKPAGRGLKLLPTPIELYAKKFNIQIFTPKTLKKQQEIDSLLKLQPDLIIVAAYGLLLPQAVLDIPKLGCLNIHGSLLPKWRGAAPIHRAIMAGDSETGVTIMKMSAGLDEGDVFAMKSLSLKNSDTMGDIHNQLANIGADLLIEVINKIQNNQIQAFPQDHSLTTYAHKITKEECELDFVNYTATEIIRKINALNPFPSAFFIHKEHRYKIYQAEIIEKSGIAGNIDNNFIIYCQSNAIRPKIIQKQGRQKQSITDFLNGEKNNQA